MRTIPDLTYFIGRPFEKLVKGSYQGSDVTRWEIHLAEGAVIANKDHSVAIPDEDDLAGTVFIRPIYSELDTRLQFGVRDEVAVEITLTPTKYSISDPLFSPQGEIYPQAPPQITTPPDPSGERVAEGPEEESEMETEEKKPDEETTEESTETEEGTEEGTDDGDDTDDGEDESSS